MFSKILVANRGEIACRIMKTARRMGIATVAVYSDADRDAPHVEMADEAVRLGPPAASESYLDVAKMVEAARATGAQAVHPGYGFLSENPAFAQALGEAGIVFIGPPVPAIEAMGDKIASKRVASEAGVSTVPGFLGVIEDEAHAEAIADEIGYPVMIKASAGGGGKGMRIAESRSEVREGFTRARSEARSSFGDERVFIEKFIVEPRHIEIQVLADRHGNVVHLGERECSIQRRNQKVIEEAPSPFLDPETRARMGAQAVALANAVGYESAGTVEFIVDRERNFYFLEMNTRLQVEHPVTELVTGLDLVEAMIRIAAGEPLGLSQEDVRLDGWAVESRVYAEDPYRGFLPSTGRLVTYRPPEESTSGDATVRVDDGVTEGSEISIFYDPMIAKLVTHAPTREEAISAQADALDAFAIDGIRHNIPFLSAIMDHERWREGRLSTGFIAEEFPDGFHGTPADEAVLERIVAVAAQVASFTTYRLRGLGGARAQANAADRLAVLVDGQRFDVELDELGEEGLEIALLDGNGAQLSATRVVSFWSPGEIVWQGLLDGNPVSVQLRAKGPDWAMSHRGVEAQVRVVPPRVADLMAHMPRKEPPDTSRVLLCPMPGLLVSLAVREGQEVPAGQPLAVIEAMKMENVLRAERDVVVSKILAEPGASLAVDQAIMEFA
jgi:propionyl-CoA carboxylase alpha chain